MEALLVGMNHEFAAELRWRDYPTDLRGTYFQLFWPYRSENQKDIKPIIEWPLDTLLGNNGLQVTDNDQTILLIRGDLIQRYPNASIYLVRKAAQAFPDGRPQPDFDGGEIRPTFLGQLPPDMTFIGFGLPIEQVKNHFVVFEERIGELRFGIDVADKVALENAGNLSDYADRPQAVLRDGAKAAQHFAQQPVRMAIAAERLLVRVG